MVVRKKNGREWFAVRKEEAASEKRCPGPRLGRRTGWHRRDTKQTNGTPLLVLSVQLSVFKIIGERGGQIEPVVTFFLGHPLSHSLLKVK